MKVGKLLVGHESFTPHVILKNFTEKFENSLQYPPPLADGGGCGWGCVESSSPSPLSPRTRGGNISKVVGARCIVPLQVPTKDISFISACSCEGGAKHLNDVFYPISNGNSHFLLVPGIRKKLQLLGVGNEFGLD